VSDVGGLQEVVTHNETGIKVYPNDPGSLAWGILHTLSHPEWAKARAENASRVARAEYNWDRIAALTVDVYERVINEARSSAWAYSDRAGAQKV
jgi:1,4-alpha-glucan branching enzyme